MVTNEQLKSIKINWDKIEKDLTTLSYDLYDLPKPETAYDLMCQLNPSEMANMYEPELCILTESQRTKLINMGYDLDVLGL